MTDARLPERWLMDRRIQRLNAEQFRAYTMSLMYAVCNRTDGQLTEDDIEAIPHFERGSIPPLVAAGLWRQEEGSGGWVITDYLATQTSRAQLEAAEMARTKEAQRSAQNRGRAKAARAVTDAESCSTPDSTAYGTAYDTGQARQGQDRQKTLSSGIESSDAMPGNPMAQKPVASPVTAAVTRNPGSEGMPVSVGRLALDPDAWPADDDALSWRTWCEENSVLTVQGLIDAWPGLNEAQALNMLAGAYPGREWS
ncbi:hypothetical protein [Arthrobacter sp. 4R501]|uniref:hypothetical protein n=1 Tax=Arthrobacter sp. 4R501 TaxID=2058886 RepID=UPI000CE41429|nr:hypothetical protein [Arthrobacter sp. 4R501]